ncbi:hypothetical protein llap_4797 [Limosa lapponica baueri]|uniref:Uncharacterized protein n=1 Tax=Limosa lapponica baueri TaxID=1758121 RepID=A0A2I0UFT0_LIMLA|nr:hypothetical protein llap_4797 [Limosa lapponica baueri]
MLTTMAVALTLSGVKTNTRSTTCTGNKFMAILLLAPSGFGHVATRLLKCIRSIYMVLEMPERGAAEQIARRLMEKKSQQQGTTEEGGMRKGKCKTVCRTAVSLRVQGLRESGWYGEEMLELELDQVAGELLDPSLLPEKCLCNYTINVVFMPMLYETDYIADSCLQDVLLMESIITCVTRIRKYNIGYETRDLCDAVLAGALLGWLGSVEPRGKRGCGREEGSVCSLLQKMEPG